MKTKLIFLLITLPFIIFANQINIMVDGSGDFPTIQDAIENSTPNDTLIIHPGEYFENLHIYNKSDITLTSLYYTNADTTYISSTIINGNQIESCVFVENSQNIFINGFTITNGIGSISQYGSLVGGGIYCKESQLNILSCHIQNNQATYGGGVLIITNSEAFLSKTKIYNNHAIISGGGLFYTFSNVVFDEVNLNSIYNNYSATGQDINYGNTINPNFVFDIFSVLNPDKEYICNVNDETEVHTFSCNTAYLEQEYRDLYVSPDGDDSNSGLSFDDPLQTIAKACQMIKADSLNPATIYLTDGIYSPSLNNQLFPINARSHISIIGESEENTIFDGDQYYEGILGIQGEKGINIKNITFQNFETVRSSLLYFSGDLLTDDIIDSVNVNLENITIRNSTSHSDDWGYRGLTLTQSINSTVKNLTMHNNMFSSSVLIGGGDTYLENIRIYDNNATNSFPLNIAINYRSTFRPWNPNYIVNLEIYNNYCTHYEFGDSPVIYISANKVYMSNATITDNIGVLQSAGAISLDNAQLDIFNSIIYGNYPYQFQLDSSIYTTELNAQNCCIEDGLETIPAVGENIITYENIIDENPQFLGEGAEFPYMLNHTSPCIDAGTLDLPDHFILPEYDIAGNPRVYGETVDIGAYEWNGVSNSNDINQAKIDFKIYPNPLSLEKNRKSVFNISIDLDRESLVSLNIYNIKGQKIRTITKAYLDKSVHNLAWDGKDDFDNIVSSGTYLCKLETETDSIVKKIIVLK